MLQPNTDTRIDAKTVGEVLLKSRGFFTEPYWFWICIVALLGFSLLFNLFYIIALMYLNRKCSYIRIFRLFQILITDKILNNVSFQLLVTQKLLLWKKVKTNIKGIAVDQILLWNSVTVQAMDQREEWFYLSNHFHLHFKT